VEILQRIGKLEELIGSFVHKNWPGGLLMMATCAQRTL
jgi:hypothetical protein